MPANSDAEKENQYRIRVMKNGPYLVSGAVPLAKETIVSDHEGTAVRWEQGEKHPDRERYILCRRGKQLKRNEPAGSCSHTIAVKGKKEGASGQ